MLQFNRNRNSAGALLAGVLALASAALAVDANAAPGAVYTMSNAPGGNAVIVYGRTANGMLGNPQYVPTGGNGTGSGLGSQGAIALSRDGRWLVVVNAGSNDVSVFDADAPQLTFKSRTPSGGTMPISVAIDENVVFVLNAGAGANITGFRLTRSGTLVPIPGSTRVLPGSAPAQVSFANDGETLVVTEKNSNTITTYTYDDGQLSGPITAPSAGATPFGFAVNKGDVLVVSEAEGGSSGASTVSSYIIDDEAASLRLVTDALPTGQTAACWVAVTRNGRFAYIANAGSASISSVRVRRDGSLRMLKAVAGEAPAGTHPIDLALNVNSRYLYSLASGTVSVFRVGFDGSLTPVQVVSGLPAGTAGLAAR